MRAFSLPAGDNLHFLILHLPRATPHRYDNWIGGQFVAPVEGKYFENPTPVTGQVYCEVARSTAADIELALDAAHAAAPAWGKTSAGERAVVLNKIADRIEENLEQLAVIVKKVGGTTSASTGDAPVSSAG